MLGEVVGCDEGQHVRLEAFEVFVVEDFDRGVFDGAVHSLCLAVGPGMVGLGQPMLDPLFDADAIEDVRAEETPAGAFAILGQIGEGHTEWRSAIRIGTDSALSSPPRPSECTSTGRRTVRAARRPVPKCRCLWSRSPPAMT